MVAHLQMVWEGKMKFGWPFSKNSERVAKNPHAVILGQAGQKAYLEKTTPEQRREWSRKGGRARHGLSSPPMSSQTIAEAVVTKILADGEWEGTELTDALSEMERIPGLWEEIAQDTVFDEPDQSSYAAALFAAAQIIRFSLKA